MTATSLFPRFCAEFCKEADAAMPRFNGSADDPKGFEMELDGTSITVLHVSHEGVEDVRVLIEFGTPARPDDAAVWQGLLDANFTMTGHCSLCFSRDPQTGDVMLQMKAPLATAAEAAATGALMLQECRQLAAMAAGWRRGDLRIGARCESAAFA